jgi:hypothetical protein
MDVDATWTRDGGHKQPFPTNQPTNQPTSQKKKKKKKRTRTTFFTQTNQLTPPLTEKMEDTVTVIPKNAA